MNTEEAVRRLRLITPMLRNDMKTAILSYAVMEAANRTIPRGLAHGSLSFLLRRLSAASKRIAASGRATADMRSKRSDTAQPPQGDIGALAVAQAAAAKISSSHARAG
jgi:hypothetical protein